MDFVKHHRSYQSIVCFATKLNLASRNKGWSKEEDARLIEYYNTHDKINMTEILTLFPNRTKGSLLNRAVALKLSKAKHYWTAEEDKIVLQYSILGDKVLDQLPGISKMQLMQRASRLGIKNPDYEKQNLVQYITDAQQKLLQDYYSNNNWSELYKLFPNKSKNAIWASLNKLGIKKQNRGYSDEQINIINTEFINLGGKGLKTKYPEIFNNKSSSAINAYAKLHNIKCTNRYNRENKNEE